MTDAPPLKDNLHWVNECWSHLRRGYEGDPERVEIFGFEAILRLLNEEFTFNRLQNKAFRKTISCSCEAAVAFLREQKLHAELALLLSQIQQLVLDGDSMRLRANTRDAIAICDSGEYIVALLGRLKAMVVKSPLVPTTARKLLNEIFSAFLLRDYTPAEVEEIIPKAFFNTESEVDGVFRTTFIDVPKSDVDLSLHPPNLKAWGEHLRAFIQSLSFDARFDAIARYYHKPLQPLRVVAQIRGVKLNAPVTVGEFELYPARQIQEATKDNGLFPASFPINEDTSDDRINAAVTIPGRSMDSTVSRAFELFRSLSDALNMAWNTRLRIQLIEDRVLIFDGDGNLRRLGTGGKHQVEHLYKYLSIDGNAYSQHISWPVIEKAARAIVSETSIADRRYTTALRAFGRAKEASPDQAILNYWIVIDSLLAVADLPGILTESADRTESVAQEFLPAAIALHSLSGIGWDLYNDLSYAWINRQQAFKNIFANVSRELVQESGLEYLPFATLDLANLITRLDKWHDALPVSYIRDRVDDVKAFYSDEKSRKATIYQLHRRAVDEVAIFYQLRNRVVHHADKSSDMFRVFVDRAKNYAGLILSYAKADDVADLRESVAVTINAWERIKQLMVSNQSFDPLEFDGLIRRRLRKNQPSSTL